MATSHNGVDVTEHFTPPTATVKQRLSNLLQTMRAQNDAFGNAVARDMGADSPQKVNRNHGNNPVNNLTQG